jgi:hypothetical protein
LRTIALEKKSKKEKDMPEQSRKMPKEEEQNKSAKL